MTGPSLARLARTAVAGGGHGQIVLGFPALRGDGRPPVRVPVVMIDHDGEPLLAVTSPEALAQVVDRLVQVDVAPLDGVQVHLSGRVVRAQAQRAVEESGRWEAGILHACLREGATLLQLSVEGVTVGQDDRGGKPQRVTLEDYAMAEPDAIAAHGPRILTHLNDAHPMRLRTTAARVLGVAADNVLDARLVALDAEGADLSVLDADGSRLVRIGFTRPVADIDDLVITLRCILAKTRTRSTR
jgi:hypothetical protein